MASDFLPEEFMAQLYQAFMNEQVRLARSGDEDDDESYYDEDNIDYDDDDIYSSDGSVDASAGEFGNMLNDMLKSFVTEPDFDKGFQYSHKVLGHHQLEEINEYLRRQLATALISIKDPRRGNTGGLLDVKLVNDCVLKKINDLGQETDALSEACRVAKQGDSVLTERTERMQHRVDKLNSWIEWLKMPSAPVTGGSGCGNPNCPCSRPQHVAPAGTDSIADHTNVSSANSARTKGVVDPHKAADEAMQQLLLEEEAEQQKKSKSKKQGRGNQDQKPKKQGQKRKTKKQAHAQRGHAGASTSVKTTTHVSDDSDDSSDDETTAAVTATGQPVTVSRVNENLLNIVHSSFQARMEAKRSAPLLPFMSWSHDCSICSVCGRFKASVCLDAQFHSGIFAVTASTFSALGMLGEDDEVPEEWTAAKSKKKLAKDRARGHGTAPASSAAGSSSRLQTKLNADVELNRSSGNPDDAAPDDYEIRKSANTFMQLVKHEGRWEHHWLVNSLNPATQYHNADVRAAYKALHKSVQQHVWKLLASSTPIKRQQPTPSPSAARSPGVVPTPPSRATASPLPTQTHKPLSPDIMSAAGSHFMGLLQRHGVSSQVALTNALNPASPTHIPAVRATYKSLNKKDSKLAWHVLPAQVAGAPAANAASHYAHPASPVNTQGQRLMSRMGSRPVPGSRPALGSRPVPGSRPSSERPAHQMADVTLQDPIPEDSESELTNIPSDMPKWVHDHQPRGEDDESKLCCVCLDQPRDAMLLPCKHAVTCISCAIMVKDNTGECPYCRVNIQNVLCVQ